MAADLEQKSTKLELEVKTKCKELQQRLDTEKKRAKDIETKYHKLEEMAEKDRRKIETERHKFKDDMADLKRRYEETKADFEQLRRSYTNREESWKTEKALLMERVTTAEVASEHEAVEKAIAVADDKFAAEIQKLKDQLAAETSKANNSNGVTSTSTNGRSMEASLEENANLRKKVCLHLYKIVSGFHLRKYY